MENNDEIIREQMRELFLFRDRNVKNIEETFKSFMTIISIIVSALAIVATENNGSQFVDPSLLFGAGIFVFLYGFYVFFSLVQMQNQVIWYTKLLNISRADLIRGKHIRYKIYLPVNEKGLEFGKYSFLQLPFAWLGPAGVVRLINSLIIMALAFIFIKNDFCPILKPCMNLGPNLILIFVVIYLLHELVNKHIIRSARTRWKELRISGKNSQKEKSKDKD